MDKADESLAQDLWGEVRKHAKDNWSDENVSPPFSKMDLQTPIMTGGRSSELGLYMDRAATYYIPSLSRKVTSNFKGNKLQKLLATPIPWTLTLGELLRLKPELLEGIVQSLAMKNMPTSDTPNLDSESK